MNIKIMPNLDSKPVLLYMIKIESMTKLFPGFNYFLLVFFNFQSKTDVDGKTN